VPPCGSAYGVQQGKWAKVVPRDRPARWRQRREKKRERKKNFLLSKIPQKERFRGSRKNTPKKDGRNFQKGLHQNKP